MKREFCQRIGIHKLHSPKDLEHVEPTRASRQRRGFEMLLQLRMSCKTL